MGNMQLNSLQAPRIYFLIGHIYFLLFIGLAAFLFRERDFVADTDGTLRLHINEDQRTTGDETGYFVVAVDVMPE